MHTIVVSDLHFTLSPRDEYRWKLLDQLRDLGGTTVILGDLTDAKDAHRAQLVNRIAKGLASLEQVIVLRGNHDYLEADHPFFEFLSLCPHISFVNRTTEMTLNGLRWLFVPHSHDLGPEFDSPDWGEYDLVAIHQTVNGAVASNGQEMAASLPSRFCRVLPKLQLLSGDIHVPQVCGHVTYVGSPYHVHFGDRFSPRGLRIDPGGRISNVTFPNTSRFTIEITTADDLKSQSIPPHSQLKVRVRLQHTDVLNWHDIKREVVAACRELKLELCGIELLPTERKRIALTPPDRVPALSGSPEECLRRYAAAEQLSEDLLAAGLELLK